MDTRLKIIISMLLVIALAVGAGYIYVSYQNYMVVVEEAVLYGILPHGKNKEELLEEIQNIKDGILIENQMVELRKEAAKYELDLTGMTLEQAKKALEDFKNSIISIRGTVFSILPSADAQIRAWTVIGDKMPDTIYTAAECLTTKDTPIYRGDTEELMGFREVLEGHTVEIMFEEILDETATPIKVKPKWVRVLE